MKKDNEFVYHARVPALDSLPEVRGAALCKGIPFDASDKDIVGRDIFEKLVPIEAHEASSIYRFDFTPELFSSCITVS